MTAKPDSAIIGSNQTTGWSRDFDDSADDGVCVGIFPIPEVFGLLLRGFFFLLNVQLLRTILEPRSPFIICYVTRVQLLDTVNDMLYFARSCC